MCKRIRGMLFGTDYVSWRPVLLLFRWKVSVDSSRFQPCSDWRWALTSKTIIIGHWLTADDDFNCKSNFNYKGVYINLKYEKKNHDYNTYELFNVLNNIYICSFVWGFCWLSGNRNFINMNTFVHLILISIKSW